MTNSVTETARETGEAVHDTKDEAAERASDSSWVEALARAGLIARGVLYVLVAAVALQLATGHEAEEPDKHGALEGVARQPLGRLLLAALTLGFAGYALWRYVQGILNPGGESGWAKRLGNVARGVLYTSFVVTTVPLVVGAGGGHDPHKEIDVTARVLALPIGRFLVAAVGLALIAGGAYQLWRAVTRKYWRKLADGGIRPVARWAVVAVATFGLAARTVVFCAVGLCLVRAAVRFNPNEAAGVDEALQRLAAAPHGAELLALLAGGLAAFGIFSFVEAAYRRVPEQ